MKLTVLRELIRVWFLSKVRVDRFSLTQPKGLLTDIFGTAYPANTAIEAPIRDVYFEENKDQLNQALHVIFPYSVSYRFSATFDVFDLPQAELQALYCNVVSSWKAEGEELDDDILSIGITDIVESPVVVGRVKERTGAVEDNSDWLVTLFFEFEVTFNYHPELVPTIQPGEDLPIPNDQPITITFGLWRSRIDEVGNQDQSYLDSETTIAPIVP